MTTPRRSRFIGNETRPNLARGDSLREEPSSSREGDGLQSRWWHGGFGLLQAKTPSIVRDSIKWDLKEGTKQLNAHGWMAAGIDNDCT